MLLPSHNNRINEAYNVQKRINGAYYEQCFYLGSANDNRRLLCKQWVISDNINIKLRQ
jgi:hypothetical protein